MQEYILGIRDEANARVLLYLDYNNKFMPININQAEPFVIYKIRSGSEVFFQVNGKRYGRPFDQGQAQIIYELCNLYDISDLLTVDKVIQENLGDIICQEIPSALS